MHDISDLRFRPKSEMSYGGDGLWKGMERAYRGDGRGSRICLGWVFTLVDQAISVVDFLTRNGGELRSADESFHREIGQSPERLAEMQRMLPPEDWSMMGDWAYFSLNDLPAPYTFPRFARAPRAGLRRSGARDPRETPEIRATRTLDLFKIAVRRVLSYPMRRS
jgi:hypothetical protein